MRHAQDRFDPGAWSAGRAIAVWALLLTPLVVCAGCGTVDTIVGGGMMDRAAPPFGIYSGTRHDWNVAHHGHILPFLGYVDLPFSLVLDTALLPVSATIEAVH